MPVTVKTRPKRDVVTFLSGVDVEFVSLVKHGANWTPFTAIKTDAGDRCMAGQVVQSILVPVGMDLSVLKDVYGSEWFSQVKTHDAQSLDALVRFVQRSEDDFEAPAFHLVDAAQTGALFVCGLLKADKDEGTSLRLPEVPMSKARVEASTQVPPSFADEFCSKIDEYIRTIENVTTLTSDAETQINTHIQAWEAFDVFMRTALEKTGIQAGKLGRPDRLAYAGHNTGGHEPPAALTTRRSQMTKEDIEGIATAAAMQEVRKILDADFSERLREGLHGIEKALDAVEKTAKSQDQRGEAGNHQMGDALSELSERLRTLEGELKKVEKRQESLEHTTVCRPSSPEDTWIPEDPEDELDHKNPARAFKGMFDRMPI
jgi:hypothetical protein